MSANYKGPLSLPTYSFADAMNAQNDNNEEPSGATQFLPVARPCTKLHIQRIHLSLFLHPQIGWTNNSPAPNHRNSKPIKKPFNDQLLGGLYGVALGKVFCGESMFHTATDASKIALVFLVEFLREQKFELLDTQYLNPHLIQLGAYEITQEEYMLQFNEILNRSLPL